MSRSFSAIVGILLFINAVLFSIPPADWTAVVFSTLLSALLWHLWWTKPSDSETD